MGKRWKQCQTFLGGSKITADGDCSHEIKRCLFLGRKVRTNLDSIFKSRDITLPTKVHLVKAMVFPVVMYGCECWTIKKAERRRIDAFELWCWRRLSNGFSCLCKRIHFFPQIHTYIIIPDGLLDFTHDSLEFCSK